MSVFTTDSRSKPNHIFHNPTQGASHFFMDTAKMNGLKESFNQQLLFGNINSFSDILAKNLADTLVNHNKPETNPRKMTNGYSKLSGITSFITGVFSIVSSAVFRRQKSPGDCYDEQSESKTYSRPYPRPGYKNERSSCEDNEPNSIMFDCTSAAESCEVKLNRIKPLLPPKTSQQTQPRPKTHILDSDFVEEFFDALPLENDYYISNTSFIECYIPPRYQEQELCEMDAMKRKFESKEECKSVSVNRTLPTIPEDKPKKNLEETVVNSSGVNNELELVKYSMDCDEKITELDDKMPENCKKFNLDSNSKEQESPKHTESVSIAAKDKRFKNPNRLCSKRTKSGIKQLIEEDVLFAKEVDLDEENSLENSPSYHSVECSGTPPNSTTLLDYFDEISGRFRSTPEESNEDSFQIIINDIPRRRTISDCESEDSFIVFEESPDSCYTSNDVFGDSDDDSDSDEDSDSDSDTSDSDSDSVTSDSGCSTVKLPQSLSRTLSNLTDDTLYDEVDCAKHLPTFSDSCPEESKSKLLLAEQKNAKTELPVKKVRFSPLPPKVHVMYVWQFAARQARAGHWEQFAIDRERFRRRIVDVSTVLSWVLQPQHRNKIMSQRITPWRNAQMRKELAENDESDESEAERSQSEEETTKKDYGCFDGSVMGSAASASQQNHVPKDHALA